MPLPFTAESQFGWAAAIAGRIAREFHLRGWQEREDLIQTALAKLIELYRRQPGGTWDPGRGKWVRLGFDPARMPAGGDPEGAFRGLFFRHIRSECAREATRLRNGGTFHTCRPEHLPAAVVELGAEVESLEAHDLDLAEEDLAEEARQECARVLVARFAADEIDRPVYGRRLAGSLGTRKRPA